MTKDYYSGFEGEPELRFLLERGAMEVDVVRLWVGFFDALMATVEPHNGEWRALALPYHLHAGWYDQARWKVEDLGEVLGQWKTISVADLDERCVRAHRDVLALLEDAAQNGGDVWIVYE